MNVPNAAISGDRYSRISRLIKRPAKHDSWPGGKRGVRLWLIENLKPQSVYEVYGGGQSAYKGLKLDGLKGGDAIAELNELGKWDYDIWDIDPYTRPYEAVRVVGAKASKAGIGLFVTDTLRKMCQIRAGLAAELSELMGWPKSKPGEHKQLKAWIYYHYPQALRAIIERLLLPRFEVKRMIVAGPRGPSAAAYAGVIAETRELPRRLVRSRAR